MEEGAIKVPNKIVRSETFPGTRHRQRASSGQDIDQRGSSAVPSFPGSLDLPTTPPQRPPYQQPDWNAERQSQEESVRTDVDESNDREKRFKYLSIYLPLYRAGLKGDWQATKDILDKYPDAVRVPLTKRGGTIIHTAASSKRYTFVKELLEWMPPDELEFKNADGNTALCITAVTGIVKIAEEMVKKNNKLPLIRGWREYLPLHLATLFQNRDMVSYLFKATPFKQLTASDRIELLTATISADMYDIALDILKRDPTVSTAENRAGRIALEVLAKKPFALGNGSQQSTSWYKRVWNKAFMQTLAHQVIEVLWKNIQILPDKQFSSLVEKHSSLLFVATKVGNVEFLTILLRSHLDLILEYD